MFHAKPLNQSQTQQPQVLQWPLTPQENNNLRQSQSGSKQIPVKFYLPEDEIRRSTIYTDCNLQKVTEQIKRYASVADKHIVLAWKDDQDEWIRFDTESEFSDAMEHAVSLLNVRNGVFKVQVKEGKEPSVKKQPEQQPQEQPVQQPKPVVQQPVTQPPQQQQQPQEQPITNKPVTQPPVNQPPQMQPPQFQPQFPFQPGFPQQPFRPPVQPMQPMQPMMTMMQPQMQPQQVQSQIQPSMQVRGVSPYNTPNKTLTNSVTMQQSHPLNTSSYSSPQMMQPQVQPQMQIPVTQPQMQLPVNSTNSVIPESNNNQISQADQEKLNTLRSFGFAFDDNVLMQALKEAGGDISGATDRLLLQ